MWTDPEPEDERSFSVSSASVAVISSRYLQGAHTQRSDTGSDHGREREAKVAELFFFLSPFVLMFELVVFLKRICSLLEDV